MSSSERVLCPLGGPLTQFQAPAPLSSTYGTKPASHCFNSVRYWPTSLELLAWLLSRYLYFCAMPSGTNARTGFSVRDILDLPDPTGRNGTRTVDENSRDAVMEVLGSGNGEKREFSGRSWRERGAGSLNRWNRPNHGTWFYLQMTCLVFSPINFLYLNKNHLINLELNWGNSLNEKMFLRKLWSESRFWVMAYISGLVKALSYHWTYYSYNFF